MAVLAPIPSASVDTATLVKTGCLRSIRRAYRRSAMWRLDDPYGPNVVDEPAWLSATCPEVNGVLIFRVEIEQRDELPPLIGADRAGLRHRRDVPSGRQQDRVAQAAHHAIELQLVAVQLVAAVLERAGDLQMRALLVAGNRHLQRRRR